MTDFVAILDQYARTQPDKEALRAQGQAWTYAQLAQASRRAATALCEQGVGAGDRVALLCLNTPVFLFVLFGAWRIGAAVVPVNHKLQAVEVDYILDHAQVSLCIFDGALAATARALQTETVLLSTDSPAEGFVYFDPLLESAAPQAGGLAPAPGQLAEILYTSGTTGRPKGCMHSHHNILQVALSSAAGVSFTRNERTLIAMPIWHSAPLNNWTLGTLLVGGTVVLLREYAPVPFLDTMAAERISFTFGAPIAFLAPLAVAPDLSRYDFSAMRLWVYGGGPLGADMARRLAAAYCTDRFMQAYGMTETGPLGTVLHPDDALTKPGSIGCTGVPGVVVEVRNPDGTRCKAGQIGEIHIRSPGVMLGYLDDPQATAAAFDDQGWYRTGDLARVDEDGYLFIVDRLKDMIVTGGENVYSKEVEDAISAHPDVQDMAVVGRPHPEWGETVTAIVVPRAGRDIDTQALERFLQTRLARYKIPRIWQMRATLPHTATGKLLKHVLWREVVEARQA